MYMLTGADVNIADSTGNSPLHVMLSTHAQTTQQATSPANATHKSLKLFDKTSSLLEVFIAKCHSHLRVLIVFN